MLLVVSLVLVMIAGGTASVIADGTITYTSGEGFVGDDRFTYEVKDDKGVRSNEATVSLIVR